VGAKPAGLTITWVVRRQFALDTSVPATFVSHAASPPPKPGDDLTQLGRDDVFAFALNSESEAAMIFK
jgi:hypothetical protein